jgi:hypothetical protein
LKPDGGAQRRLVAPTKDGARNKALRKPRPTARRDSKTAQVIALLHRPPGASLKALMHATGWQAHSVRGFISGQLGKKMGLRVHSFQRNEERVYAIRP